jgi:hypothetical protein
MSIHERLEQEFLDMVTAAGIPAPDDTARMDRALIFLWYDTKAFVLIDLDDMPEDDPFRGFDLEMLREDVVGPAALPGLPGAPPYYAEAG